MARQFDLPSLPASLLDSLPQIPADLFPLPLTPIEKYFVWDETPEVPLTYFLELQFLDPIKIDVLEQAIAAASLSHPLLSCTLDGTDDTLQWLYHAEYRHKVQSISSSNLLNNDRPIAFDLRIEPGLRFWYSQVGQGSRLIIQVHHAVTDAVGLRRFLLDMLIIYGRATSIEEADGSWRAPWSKIQLDLLRSRHDLSGVFVGPPPKPHSFWQKIKNAHYFHFQVPTPLRGRAKSNSKISKPTVSDSDTRNQQADTSTSPFTNREDTRPFEYVVFDRATSEEILEKLKQSEAGLNRAGVALLFETCSLWNEQLGESNPRSRLRILAPYDLRSRIDFRMPAANRLTLTFFGRTSQQCRDVSQLLESLKIEMQAYSDTHLPMDFYRAIEAASKHPRFMKWVINRNRNMATAVLTYGGDVMRGMQRYLPEQDGYRIVGDARLSAVIAAPPVRDNTHISIGLCSNWGQVCIAANWNRDGLTRQQCADFLRLYQSRWIEWLRSK